MRDITGLSDTNQERILISAEYCHSALASMDEAEFRAFTATFLGQAMLLIAKEYSNTCEGLRVLYTQMYD